MVQKKVDGSRLSTPLDLSYPDNDKEKENACVEEVLRYIQAAKNPVILVDACAVRHRVSLSSATLQYTSDFVQALEEVHDLVKTSGLPTFVTPMGKGAVDETLPSFGGVYAGEGSNNGVRDIVESADLVLTIGSIKSDFNTAGFTYRISHLSTIDFHSTHVDVKWATYEGVRMNGVLRRITKEMKKFETKAVPTHDVELIEEKTTGDVITHKWMWPNFTRFFKDNDIILTETGTSGYGIFETRFGKNTTGISQVVNVVSHSQVIVC
jgi:pyruvate decarboxylase